MNKVNFPPDLPLIILPLSEEDLGDLIFHLALTNFNVGNPDEMRDFYEYLYEKKYREDAEEAGEEYDEDNKVHKVHKVTEMPHYTGFYLEIISGKYKQPVYVFHLGDHTFLLAEDDVRSDYRALEKPKYIFEYFDDKNISSVSLFHKSKEGVVTELSIYKKLNPSDMKRYINGTKVREIKDNKDNKNNKGDKLTEEITYYRNGVPMRIKRFKNGLADGIEEVWAHDGKTLLMRIPWRNGLKHGLEEKWFLLDIDEPLSLDFYIDGNSHKTSLFNYDKLLLKEIQHGSALPKVIAEIVGDYSELNNRISEKGYDLKSEYAYGQDYNKLLLQGLQRELSLPKDLIDIAGEYATIKGYKL